MDSNVVLEEFAKTLRQAFRISKNNPEALCAIADRWGELYAKMTDAPESRSYGFAGGRQDEDDD